MADVSADRIIGVIRCLSADQPSAANSGHPGAPMGMAPAAYALWSEVMNYNPADANWPNRDRFVLSNGHASALLYSMLHLTGYAVTLDDLKNFRQIGSITPGHPENHDTEGVEVTTGPLGNGFGNAVGLAIAQSHLAAVFNKPDFDLLDNYTYVFMGDGCNQEGVASEAASLAGHLKLGRLIVIYDDNDITIDGETDLSFTEDVGARYEAYGWHVTLVEDGDSDVGAIVAAIEECKAVTDKPSLIRLRTTIGFGSVKEGTESVHGSPLSSEDLSAVKAKFGLDPEATFQVPDDVKDAIAAAVAQRSAKHGEWTALFERYTAAFPDEAAEFTRRFAGELPADWRAALPSYTPDDKATATRSLSGAVLNALAPIMPEIVGGSADLTPSTKTELKCSHDYQADTPDGRYLRYGVREHAMAALMNGLAAYGAIIPFGATFLNFIGYAWGGVRLSAISHRRAIYIMTHDSIGLGEDGPTHQPIESLASVRATPNMLCIRPADGNETVGAYIAAIEATETPSVLSLSRQNLPHLAGSSAEGVLKGAYTVLPATADTTSLILVASGSEVSLCVDVAAAFDGAVAVVSMPCWELFDAQDQEYQLSVFPAGVPVLSVEAGAVTGWERYAHCSHGMRTFGASGPGDAVMAHFGFSVESITEKAQTVIDHYSNVEAEALVLRPFF